LRTSRSSLVTVTFIYSIYYVCAQRYMFVDSRRNTSIHCTAVSRHACAYSCPPAMKLRWPLSNLHTYVLLRDQLLGFVLFFFLFVDSVEKLSGTILTTMVKLKIWFHERIFESDLVYTLDYTSKKKNS
ncbi:unnamed protein product, partial [Ectocarpus sp. 13 AM-2016]